MTREDKKAVISETYEKISHQIMDYAYYAEILENVGRKKEAEQLREITSQIEDWLVDARL